MPITALTPFATPTAASTMQLQGACRMDPGIGYKDCRGRGQGSVAWYMECASGHGRPFLFQPVCTRA